MKAFRGALGLALRAWASFTVPLAPSPHGLCRGLRLHRVRGSRLWVRMVYWAPYCPGGAAFYEPWERRCSLQWGPKCQPFRPN